MPFSFKTCCFFLLLYLSLSLNIQAQPAEKEKDSLITATAYAGALQLYHAYLTPETGLFRGPRYLEYVHILREGHPYFDDGRMHEGTVLYDGIFYEHLTLLYDLVKGWAVINDAFNNYKIALIGEQVDRFTIEQHVFIRLRDSLNPSQPRNGFYEQLYKGKISLLKKEKKVVEDDLSNPPLGVQHYITHTVSYYLKKGNTYYPVNNKASLSFAMKDKSKELRKFIRKSGLSIRKDKENTLLKAAAWYDGFNQ